MDKLKFSYDQSKSRGKKTLLAFLHPTFLNCTCHSILGDHQQLRPTTSSYHLAKNYNLEVSMFERFINLGAKHVSLSLQHRMRPEIARLLVPAVYPELKNHFSVWEYPSIKGMNKNVFFLSHQIYEKEVNILYKNENLVRILLI